jgi:hypothetical protein
MPRLHHGYRLAAGTDVFAFAATVRDVLNPVRDTLDRRLLATSAVRIYDRHNYVGKTGDLTSSPWMAGLHQFYEEQTKADPNHRNHDPHGFGFSVAPDPETGRVHVLSFCERSELRMAFEAIECVEPYGYWDNSDKPDEVTADEWSERAASWKRVLPRPFAPAEKMLSFTLRTGWDVAFTVMQLDGPTEDAVSTLLVEEFGSSDRAAYIAHSLVCDHYDRAQLLASPFQMLNRVRRATQTQDLAEHIASLLAPLTVTALCSAQVSPDETVIADLARRASQVAADIAATPDED